jgi:hypothetical protein
VHPAVPSTVAHLAPPSIVLIPLGDLPPLRLVLVAMPDDWNPRLREFAHIAREVAGRRAA